MKKTHKTIGLFFIIFIISGCSHDWEIGKSVHFRWLSGNHLLKGHNQNHKFMLDPYYGEFPRIMSLNDYVELEYPENSDIDWTERWKNYFSGGGTVNYYQSYNKGIIVFLSEHKKDKDTGVWTAQALIDI